MAYYRFQLQAGEPFRAAVSGRVILIDDLGGAPGLDVTPNYGGRDLPTMPDRKKAFKFMEPFDGVTLKAAVDCNVGVFLSASDVSLGFADGSQVNVSGQVVVSNSAAARVPVDLAGGNVQVTATNVGINNDNTKPIPVQKQALTTLTDSITKAINTGAAQALISDNTLKRLRIRNESTSARVALGGANVTMANAAIILEPGETWLEDDAPGAAWYATSDQNGADVRAMGVK